MNYFPHDVAAALIARIDEHESAGVAFTADTINGPIVDGGAFLLTATTPDGTERTYRIEIEEIDPC